MNVAYKIVFGFLLKGGVLFLKENNILVNLNRAKFKRIQLRSTMGNLLYYLLENADKECISDEEIMSEVWEKHDLRASYSRLWQVYRDLNYRLTDIGVDINLLTRVKRLRGYKVNASMCTKLLTSNAQPEKIL